MRIRGVEGARRRQAARRPAAGMVGTRVRSRAGAIAPRAVPVGMLVPLRIFVGWFFLKSGIGKLGSFLHTDELRGVLAQWAAQNPYGFYKDFLTGRATEYAPFLAYVVTYTEIAVGTLLLVGLLTRLVSLVGLVLVVNYFLACGHTSWVYAGLNEVFAIALVTLAVSGAGRVAGLDARLHARASVLPFTLFY